MPAVFINYRTGDGEKSATLIKRELSNRFGDDTIFLDSSIKPGKRFPDVLRDSVHDSSVMLAVIGPTWATDPKIHREDDWVRQEILAALARGIPIVPILDGRTTERLNPADLPLPLARLAEYQSVRLDTRSVEADIARIVEAVQGYVPGLRQLPNDQSPTDEGGPVQNHIGDVAGNTVQGRDMTGGISLVKGNRGTVHTGSGSIYRDSQHVHGDGATYIAGDNTGGVSHHFGRRGREDDVR